MKILAHKGTFVKQDKTKRDMVFACLDDLPKTFLDELVVGTGEKKNYPEGMELVFDLEEHDFRIFNHSTVVGKIKHFETDFDT